MDKLTEQLANAIEAATGCKVIGGELSADKEKAFFYLRMPFDKSKYASCMDALIKLEEQPGDLVYTLDPTRDPAVLHITRREFTEAK